ncbi:hypothetical protein SAMN02910384_00238 [Pseudobutyrivibrio sp. ACV-2]|uniref:hypothetical protein n=1 Tax=Pseudobutyrivibrio sp. ACV-2 TaxID=1520801 RepID=UPI00089824E9|nr:hypothetical protein [Pseudobutyrivibrio sp. ACV-2]SDZ82581.1 hypothetical protein SAMN02910384_00238 [Pseudobutyrivibrio sp. ACV-2]
MKYTNRLSSIRIGYSAGMALIFAVANTLMCLFNGVLFDKYIFVAAINIYFFSLFLLLVIRKRREGTLPEFNYTTYGKITFIVLLCWIITFTFALFAPDFFAPFILIPIICSTVFDDSITNLLGLYFVIISALCLDFNIFMVLCYICMIAFGNVLAIFFKNKEGIERLYTLILIFAGTTLVSTIFYYLNYLEISTLVFVYAFIEGVISVVITVGIVPLYHKYVQESQIVRYDDLLNPEYSLVQDIRNFSFIEYQHASRVSILSRKCAEAINLNASLAACAGFYYRLGIIEGEPMIDNALKIANDYCFPSDVIQILAEYGAILNLPSSKESAIVHMVDSVVTKVELFDSDSMSSSWNQNMVIYQTINELSQKGYYDNSGLTMNQCLIIREILANEDILG